MPIIVNVLFLLGGVAVIGNDSEFEVESELKELLVLISKFNKDVLILANRHTAMAAPT